MAGAFLIAKKQSGDDVPLRATNDGALKVDIGSATLSVDANGVEIKNDTGNPVPASLQTVPLPDGASTAARQDTTNTTLTSINNRQAVPRTPTTTSVSSTISSTLLLAANTNRRGLSIANDSTATLRLSFSNPATTANAFLVMAPNSFLMLDQQLIITNGIYGLWTSANGTAQITEFV